MIFGVGTMEQLLQASGECCEDRRLQRTMFPPTTLSISPLPAPTSSSLLNEPVAGEEASTSPPRGSKLAPLTEDNSRMTTKTLRVSTFGGNRQTPR